MNRHYLCVLLSLKIKSSVFNWTMFNSKENQPWISIGKLMLKLKLQYFGHLMLRAIGKDSDAGKDWRQERKGMTEDEMVGWHHWLNGHGFEQAPGDGDGQGSLLCCSPRGCKELETTERLDNNSHVNLS